MGNPDQATLEAERKARRNEQAIDMRNIRLDAWRQDCGLEGLSTLHEADWGLESLIQRRVNAALGKIAGFDAKFCLEKRDTKGVPIAFDTEVAE